MLRVNVSKIIRKMTEEQLHNTIKICDLLCKKLNVEIKETKSERVKLLNAAKELHKIYIKYSYYFFESEWEDSSVSILDFLLNFEFFPDYQQLPSHIDENTIFDYLYGEAQSREMLGGDLWTGGEYKIIL